MNKIVTDRSQGEVALAGMFQKHSATRREQDRLSRFRSDAFGRVAAQGLPNRRIEEWKYTDLRSALARPFPMAGMPTLADADAANDFATLGSELDATCITIVNGHFDYAYSDLHCLPAGVEIVPLSKAMSDGHELLGDMLRVESTKDDFLAALNSAFMTDGAVIKIAAGVKVEAPVHIRFLYIGKVPFASAMRVVISVEDGAAVTLVETHEGPAAVSYQTNTMTEIVAGDNSHVSHVRLADDCGATVALSSVSAMLGTGAAFNSFNVSARAWTARHQVHIEFRGKNSTASIAGAAMLSGKQRADTTLVVDHASAECESRELFKTVVGGQATGSFQGKIVVKPESQKTDARMMSAALLLSKDATMNNKPELLIFADDVVCAHGATCGQLDEDLLFYLMARGLPRPIAEVMMVRAFLGEAAETIANETAKGAVNAFVESWLVEHTAGAKVMLEEV